MRFRFATSILVAVVLLTGTAVLGAERGAAVVGQVVTNGVEMGGTEVPSGGTVVSGSVLQTGSFPAAIHLTQGQIIRLSRNSTARFVSEAGGLVTVEVDRGTLSYRDNWGLVITAGPESSLVFAGRDAGTALTVLHKGLVAVLNSDAQEGVRQIAVNDPALIDVRKAILIRSADGSRQSLTRIAEVEGTTVRLVEPLGESFNSQSAVFQGEALKAFGADAAVSSYQSQFLPYPALAAGGKMSTSSVLALVGGAGLSGAGLKAQQQSSAQTSGDERCASPTKPCCCCCCCCDPQ